MTTMADKSKIEWCDATWNPVIGCEKVSDGCARCYAERMAMRFRKPGMPFEGVVDRFGWTGLTRFFPERLEQPFRWRRPRRIFTCSMGDLFHESLSNEQIAAVFGVMAATPQHQYVVLTKRLERAVEWYRSIRPSLLPAVIDKFGIKWIKAGGPPSIYWPLPNVIMCASVEDQPTTDERVPLLLQIPARWRGVSVEPCLSGIDLTPWLNSGMVWKNHIGGTDEGQREGIFGSGCDGLVLGKSGYRRNLEVRHIHWGKSNGNQAIYEDAGSAGARGEMRIEQTPENMVHGEFAAQDGNLCASGCVDDSQSFRDTRWNGDQSQRWKSAQQPAKQSGDSDPSGERCARWEGAWRSGKEIPNGGAQCLCKANRSASADHQKALCREAGDPGENSRDVRGEAGDSQCYPCSQALGARPRLDLVICGAETGPGKRPFKDEWALDLRYQCRMAGTPFFFKKDGNGNGTLCGVEYHEWII